MDFLTPEQFQNLRAPLTRDDSNEVLERLNTLFEHDWSLELDVFDVEHPTVRARIRIRHITRDGLGQADTLRAAEKQAVLNAARVLGMGTGNPDEAPVVASSEPAPLPEKPKAHQHIDELMQKCGELGLGKEAAKLMLEFKGYGATLDDSRKFYVALRELLKKNGHHA
ncbi:hypothetical protein [Deinococcus roseus]|uniref:Single-stranded DNA-binding protein n=1 Tax=Deinococcus roseus TaxID=392414 RepID=A0ABQ2CWV2_9DEIO|nr:hypothetical protein [Deinococcus roseus]GGJ24684.1 hypothetical protein GCM10008938_08510 [Deinococcus roseus]